MTKKQALAEATEHAKQTRMAMAVVHDPISNNAETEPSGPWGYCPNCARNAQGQFILFRWADEVIIINPA